MAQQIAVVTTDTGSFRIHAQGCKAVAAEVRQFKSNGAAKYEADNLTEIATQVWGDVAASNAEQGSAEYRTVALELLKADDQIHECLKGFPETDAAAEPAYATISSNTRNKHLIKVGELKTLCGKAIKDIVRAGEVEKRAMCSICTKSHDQKAPFVRAEQVDWSGEKPRVARVTVPGLGIDVPVREKSEPTASPRRRAAAASAAKQTAKATEAKPEPKAEPAKAAESKAEPAAKKAVAKKADQPLVAPKVAKGVKVTAQAVLEWLPGAFERGAITKSQKGSYVTVVKRLFAYAPDGMATDVYTPGLLDLLDKAFRDAEKKSEITYKVYKGDLRKCLFEFYALYAADPKGWEAKYPVKNK